MISIFTTKHRLNTLYCNTDLSACEPAGIEGTSGHPMAKRCTDETS